MGNHLPGDELHPVEVAAGHERDERLPVEALHHLDGSGRVVRSDDHVVARLGMDRRYRLGHTEDCIHVAWSKGRITGGPEI